MPRLPLGAPVSAPERFGPVQRWFGRGWFGRGWFERDLLEQSVTDRLARAGFVALLLWLAIYWALS